MHIWVLLIRIWFIVIPIIHSLTKFEKCGLVAKCGRNLDFHKRLIPKIIQKLICICPHGADAVNHLWLIESQHSLMVRAQCERMYSWPAPWIKRQLLVANLKILVKLNPTGHNAQKITKECCKTLKIRRKKASN